MASDLIERLRTHAETQIEDDIAYIQVADALMREAAAALAIEREAFFAKPLYSRRVLEQKLAGAEASLAEAKRLLKVFADAAQCLEAAIPDLKDTRGWTFQAIDFRAAARFLAQEEGRPTEEPQR
jgi:DeoR/GlpR family transcriptional regulator of sugar metabolism